MLPQTDSGNKLAMAKGTSRATLPKNPLKHFRQLPTLADTMRAWINSVRTLAAVSAMFCASEPASVLADALDVWHTNATFSASGIAFGNGRFVAVSGTSLQVSPDGVTWTQYISPPVLYYEGIAFGGGVFMAFGYPVSTNSSGPRYILQSSDALNWVKVHETPFPIRGATYGNGRFVFVGDQIISTMLNSLQWTEFQPPSSVVLEGVTFGAGRFVAVSIQNMSATVLSSDDGIIWRYDYGPKLRENLRNVAYGNRMFVATWRTNYTGGSYYHGLLASSNLVSWQTVPMPDSGQPTALSGITFGGGHFICALQNNTHTSTNGLNWVNRGAVSRASIFAFGAGTFLANGGGNGFPLVQSEVFAPPTNPPPSYLAISRYPGVTIEGTEGQTFRIEYTTNLAAGSNWLALTNISLPSNTYLWVDTSSPVLGQRFYRAVLVEQ
jgi:hypothetical protein